MGAGLPRLIQGTGASATLAPGGRRRLWRYGTPYVIGGHIQVDSRLPGTTIFSCFTPLAKQGMFGFVDGSRVFRAKNRLGRLRRLPIAQDSGPCHVSQAPERKKGHMSPATGRCLTAICHPLGHERRQIPAGRLPRRAVSGNPNTMMMYMWTSANGYAAS